MSQVLERDFSITNQPAAYRAANTEVDTLDEKFLSASTHCTRHHIIATGPITFGRSPAASVSLV